MRHVIPGREVYELWANERQEEAWNGRDTCSFLGPDAYSYGAIIGTRVRNAGGERAFLLSNRTWSRTTSKHQAWCRQAARDTGVPVFTVRTVDTDGDSHEWNVRDYQARIEALEGKRDRARTQRDWYERELVALRDEAGHYVRFFGLAEHLTPTLADELAARREAEEARVRAECEEALAAEAERWVRGERVDPVYGARDSRLRVWREPGGLWTVETSEGYSRTLDEAHALYADYLAGRFDRAARDVDGARVLNGETHLHVGCQRIPHADIERVARELGWDRSEVAAPATAEVA